MNAQTTNPALTTAIAYLSAREHGPHVIWYDHAVQHLVFALREDVERLGQMLGDGTRDAYSIWCSDAVIGDWLVVDRVTEDHLGPDATEDDLEPYSEAVVSSLADAGVHAARRWDGDGVIVITAWCDRDTYQPIAERVLTEGWS